MKLIVGFILLLLPFSFLAQTPIPQNGVDQTPNNSFVLYNVTILSAPGKTLNNATIVVRNGKIASVGLKLNLPNDIPQIDGKGKVVVPSFIECNSTIGIQQPKGGWELYPQLETKKNGPVYWNESIHPELQTADLYTIDSQQLDDFQNMGFGLILTHQNDGVAQGYGTLIDTRKTTKTAVLHTKIGSFYSFEKGVSNQTYPSSQMGSIALLRQAFYDAAWHKSFGTTPNVSLDALNDQLNHPRFFHTRSPYELMRVQRIANEFKHPFILIGTGKEYELGNLFDTLKIPMVIPINFPAAFDMKDPYVARQIAFEDLKHWELAPTNPSFLAQNNVPFAISASGIKSSDFWPNIHKALAQGLTIENALRALTLEPAKLLGIEKEYGTIEEGKWAYFSIYDVDPFQYQSQLLETVIKGERTIKNVLPEVDIRGSYSLNISGTKYILTISGEIGKYDGKVKAPRTIKDSITGNTKSDTLTFDATIQYSENDISIQFFLKDKIGSHYSLKGIVNPRYYIFEGDGIDHNGQWVKWGAIRNESEKTKPLEQAWKIDNSIIGPTLYPNMAYGFDTLPGHQYIVFENVTVWTNEADGIIDNATVIVDNGKIKSILRGANSYTLPAGAKIINGEGMHLTAGIIDEHSHIAIANGVNEGGQAISCEVSIGDVVTADDINVYRQLSGGVTAAQLLHGSANPVGGQSALIKLKWGHLPQDYLIPNAPKFVKFALGENVKQANWGDFNTVRFPQTRMGVEQVYIDGFNRALAYHKAKEEYAKLSEKEKQNKNVTPPAIDLELEALYEIVKGERRITCHSYIQSEINMLMHVADSFGFNVNTFTHILEGYKVADKMLAHGAGASTFADWWAYKFEVKDAIPYNAAMMHKMGITVAINSDDAEMGRRLNQEAAKVVKYGGVSEVEAWKMVTLNPAKLLHIDDRTGSIKAGKDADLVLWTSNPLSIEAKVLYTVVDGEILYDYQRDTQMRNEMALERARILAKMNQAAAAGERVVTYVKKKRGQYHCNTLGEETSLEANEH